MLGSSAVFPDHGRVWRRARVHEYARPWLAGGILVAALTTAIATMAIAQPRKGAASKPKPATPMTESVADDGGPPTASTAMAADGGAPAGPTKPESSDGGKPSPLNPQPNELPGNVTGAPAAGQTTSAQTTGADYDKILGEISALRARVAAVQDGLFRSRIAIALRTETDHAKLGRLTVSLDDGVVFTAPTSFRAEDMTAVYEHAVSPGRHAISVEVDLLSDKDDAFRTSQRSRFVVDVPKDQRLVVELRVTDDSTMGADFPGDRSGQYDLRVRMKATARAVTR